MNAWVLGFVILAVFGGFGCLKLVEYLLDGAAQINQRDSEDL